MDIVDKVFENLNLNYDAAKERSHIAKLRQKESLSRQKLRLGLFGGATAIVVAGVSAAIILPKALNQTSADSDISVVFNESDQPISEIIFKAVEDTTAANTTSNEDDHEQQTAVETNESTAIINAARHNTPQKNTTTQRTTTVEETIIHVIDSGEQVDQGSNDKCHAIETGSTGVVLWCEDQSAPTSSENNESNQPTESQDSINTEDDGASSTEAN